MNALPAPITYTRRVRMTAEVSGRTRTNEKTGGVVVKVARSAHKYCLLHFERTHRVNGEQQPAIDLLSFRVRAQTARIQFLLK